MKSASAVIAGMGCWAFTVHTKAGIEALQAVKKEQLTGQKNPVSAVRLF